MIDAQFGYPSGVGCYRVGRRLGVPVFITIRGVEQDEIKDRRIGPQLIEALSECAGVIAVSESLKRAVVARGVPAAQVYVIPNAVDDRWFHPAKTDVARRHVRLPSDARFVLSVGHLNERKGAHILIPAFARVREVYPDANLILIGGESYGEPGYVPRLKRMITELGLESCVRFEGRVAPEQVGDWMRAADVFALASRREGCCNVVLEALACGVPVVATDVGDNARYVTADRGAIVLAENSEALANGLLRVLDQRENQVGMAPELSRRTWNDVARETIEFVQERVKMYRGQAPGRQAVTVSSPECRTALSASGDSIPKAHHL